jgi:hypothetical protein
MHDVLRMLGGEQWADIQAARNQRQQLLAAVSLIVVLVLLGVALIRLASASLEA